MLRIAALAFAGAIAAAGGPFASPFAAPPLAERASLEAADIATPARGDADSRETLRVYYSPLDSTRVSRFVGFGTAYHMAIVYTDASGRSYGASSGPSNLATRQTPANALSALVAAAGEAPSAFGTLIADPRNDTPFQIGGGGDYYTHDAAGHAYPVAVVAHGRNLSTAWATVLHTYARLDGMHLPYSPISQNSNTVAVTALRRAGLGVQFSRTTFFAPGSFTQLPDA